MIEYFVNEEKKTIAAVLRDCDFDAINVIHKRTQNTDNITIKKYDKYFMPTRFTGVAKCDPRDAFSVEDGKHIAKKKCIDKYHKSLEKTVHRYCVNLYKEMDMTVGSLVR